MKKPANKYRVAPKKTPHNALKAACVEFLKLGGHAAWPNNTGAFTGEYKGKTRFVRFSVKGASDVFGVLKPMGRFIAAECKVGRDKLRPEQVEFMEAIRSVGGIVVEVRKLDDLVDAVKTAESSKT